MPRRIFQFRVSLSEVTPQVWRRVQLPGAYTLDRVHRVIQYAMGWCQYHLHSFDIDEVQYGEPDDDGMLVLRDEIDVRLDAVCGKGARFSYVYDFGDWWEHDVVVEDVFAAEPGERYPVCVAGERACPPEDVGGPFGYVAMLAALGDPAHAEHEAAFRLAGPSYDPALFDASHVTTLLRRLA